MRCKSFTKMNKVTTGYRVMDFERFFSVLKNPGICLGIKSGIWWRYLDRQ